MTTTPSAKAHAAGVLKAVRRCGRQIGDARAPEDAERPYGVFYDLSGGMFDGPVDDPDADVAFPFQITCVGDKPEQARAMADKVRRALADGVTVENRSVERIEPDGGFGAVQRDDQLGDAAFYLTPRWRLYTTPA